MTALLRSAVLLAVVLGPVAVARAEGDVSEELRQVLASEGDAGADAYLRGVLGGYRAGGETERALDAADAALALLPWERGHAHATDLVATVLERERGQPRAWRAAFGLRDRVLAALDGASGAPFLERLAAAYPGQDAFPLALARLHKGVGRPHLARTLFEDVAVRGGDLAVEALYELAVLDEVEGDPAGALRRYDAILARDPEQTWARLYRARVLRHTMRDYARAEAALADVRSAVERLPAGTGRDRLRARLEGELEELTAARRRRDDLVAADAHIDRALMGALAAWLVLLVAGGLLLRRRGLL